jgi:hypothetical protein
VMLSKRTQILSSTRRALVQSLSWSNHNDEVLTLPATQFPSIIPPSGGVMRQKLPGAGGINLRVSLMHAPRYGRSFTALHVISLCDVNALRISATSFLYVPSLVRTRYNHALSAMAVVSLPAPLPCSQPN